MGLDASDYSLVQEIKKAVRDGSETTHRLLRQLNEREQEALAVQRDILKAFNRMADNIAALSEAVEGLRNDLAPPLEKPKKLRQAPPPAARGGKA